MPESQMNKIIPVSFAFFKQIAPLTEEVAPICMFTVSITETMCTMIAITTNGLQVVREVPIYKMFPESPADTDASLPTAGKGAALSGESLTASDQESNSQELPRPDVTFAQKPTRQPPKN